MLRSYRITVSYRDCRRDFEIPQAADTVRLGTTASCVFRLNEDDFFDSVELLFRRFEGQWQVLCGSGLYLYDGDGTRREIIRLKHGDILDVRYSSTGADAFRLEFAMDFESRLPVYNSSSGLAGREQVRISSRADADLILTSDLCRNSAVLLRRQEDHFILEEQESPYGVYLNGTRIIRTCALEENDFFSVSDAVFYYRNGELYFDGSKVSPGKSRIREIEKTGPFRYPVFVRNTRRKICPDRRDIEILDPPPLPPEPENSAVLTLLPAVSMFMLTVVLRGMLNPAAGTYALFAVCSAGIGAAVTAAGVVQRRKTYKKKKKERRDIYRKYIRKKEEEIREARRQEEEVLSDIWYSPVKGIRKVMNFDADCFDRTPGDADYLDLFLGTGRRLSLRQIRYKAKEQLQEGDDLGKLPEELYTRYRFIGNAPVVIPLREAGAIGITGNENARCCFFRNIIADIICRQFCREVVFFVLAGPGAERYAWIRNLPQLQPDGPDRNIVYDSISRTRVFEKLYKELTLRRESAGDGRHMLVFVLNDQDLTGHPVSRFIADAACLGTTFIFFEEDPAHLPLHCTRIVELTGGRTGQVYSSSDRTERTSFTFEKIPEEAIRKLALKVAPVYSREISLEGALCSRLSLFELLGIYQASDLDLEKNWETGAASMSMAVPVGVNAAGKTIFLDLHEKAHGPHGLVAGTTGSGKSEFLQTFIVSCAVHFHPCEIGFVIIDFKGGGMANQFRTLPHLLGTLTNMDGKEAGRFMRSLRAELLKRQELFSKAGVNQIDRYIQLCREGMAAVPLPHLVIIVDEFAELRAEKPDFMKELISASRIGRSLGVHLILATQKPAGQVSEQIWSNSRFRLCLKVQDRQDSREMIRSPLAAEIKEPGRAYLQVGSNEVFELLQSAYSGGPAIREDESSRKRFTIYTYGMGGRTGILFEQKIPSSGAGAGTELEALVCEIRSFCETRGIRMPESICRLPLAEKYLYPELPAGTGSLLKIPVGIYDDPDHQRQGILISEAGRENTVLTGSSQTGKTNFLQVVIRFIAEHYSPEQAGFYILDFGSMFLKNFEKLAHVGGVVLVQEPERVRNLFRFLLRELKKRQERFAKAGVSSFYAYTDAGCTGMRKLYILLDNYTAFRELYMEKYEQSFLKLCRDGPSCGLTVIAANNSAAGIGYRCLSCFSERICFFCNDRNDYSTMFGRCPPEPEEIPGRVVFLKDTGMYEAQIYMAFEGKREIDRADAVRSFTAAVNDRYRGLQPAERIPEIPASLSWESFIRRYSRFISCDVVPVGLDYESLEPVMVNLREDLEFAVISRKREKVRQFLRAFMECAREAAGRLVRFFIFDDAERHLGNMQNVPAAYRYTADVCELGNILREVLEMVRSNKTAVCAGEKGAAEMKYPVVILNSREVMQAFTSPGDVFECFREITDTYRQYGVLFVYAAVENESVSYNGPEIPKRVRNARRLIFLDDLGSFRLFDIPMGAARAFREEMKADEGYWIDGTDIKKLKCFSCQTSRERKDIYE